MSDNKSHSPIGASSAARWFECPGSVALSRQAPPQESSKHAEQGTAAHTVLEECFDTNNNPWQYEGMEYEGGELDERDIQAVVDAIDWLDEKVADIRAKHGNVVILKEVGFDLSVLHKDLWGTSDIVIYTTDFSFLGTYDYKHGSGVFVNVKNNRQLKYYSLGAINFTGHKFVDTLGWGHVFREMEMGILQPRCDNMATEAISADEMDAFATELEMRALKTQDPDAEYSAGDHCRWCKAKPLCPQLYGKTVELAQQDFAVAKTLTLPDKRQLSNAEIANIISFEPIITDWLKSLKHHAQSLLETGAEVPGFKLVKKKANRVWADKEVLETKLKWLGYNDFDIFEQKLKSPAKMEKEIPEIKTDLKHLITKPETGNTIAPEADRRQAVSPSAITDFQPISEGENNE